MNKQAIIDEMQVLPSIDPKMEITRRVDFIKQQIKASGCKGLVLGISGGVDNTDGVTGEVGDVGLGSIRRDGHTAGGGTDRDGRSDVVLGRPRWRGLGDSRNPDEHTQHEGNNNPTDNHNSRT